MLLSVTTKGAAQAVCEARHEEIVAKVDIDGGIHMIVAHIEFNCEQFSNGTFSTTSRSRLRGGAERSEKGTASMLAAVPSKRWLGVLT